MVFVGIFAFECITLNLIDFPLQPIRDTVEYFEIVV